MKFQDVYLSPAEFLKIVEEVWEQSPFDNAALQHPEDVQWAGQIITQIAGQAIALYATVLTDRIS